MHKVVIVEDEKALLSVLKEKFEKEGFKVATAKDGGVAMGVIKKAKPDIILLDLILPKKTGFKVLEELKRSADLDTIPVIVLSNLDQDTDIKKAMSLGAVDYYVKAQHPLKEIVAKVERQLLSGSIKRTRVEEDEEIVDEPEEEEGIKLKKSGEK